MSDGSSPLWSERYVLLHLHQQAFLGFCGNTPWFANKGGKKRDGSRLGNTENQQDLQSGVKTQGKNLASLPVLRWHLLAHGPTVLSCAWEKKKSTKLLKVIQKSICQLGMHPCLGNCRKKGILGHTVSYIPQHREGNRSMLGAGPKAGHCMALSWQVKCLSHTASVGFAPSSVL